jgi:hypothetical protein
MKKMVVICLIFVGIIFLVRTPAVANGLTWDGRYLWTCGFFDETIYKIDPWYSGYKVMQTFTWPGPESPRWRDLAWDGNYLWAASWADNPDILPPWKVHKLNPNDGSEISSFIVPFAGHPDGLTWDGTYLWVGEEAHSPGYQGSVHRIDPTTGQIVQSFPAYPTAVESDPRGLAWDGSSIWAAYQTDNSIRQHDITNGSILNFFASPLAFGPQGLAFDGRYLWVTGGGPSPIYASYYQIEPSDGRVIYSFNPLINVNIDIKPRAYPNTINLTSKGTIRVAILTTTDFDANTVDPSSIIFADASAIDWTMRDVNRDRKVDMVLNFKIQDLNLNSSSTVGILTGETVTGMAIEGSDSLVIVTKGKK